MKKIHQAQRRNQSGGFCGSQQSKRLAKPWRWRLKAENRRNGEAAGEEKLVK